MLLEFETRGEELDFLLGGDAVDHGFDFVPLPDGDCAERGEDRPPDDAEAEGAAASEGATALEFETAEEELGFALGDTADLDHDVAPLPDEHGAARADDRDPPAEDDADEEGANVDGRLASDPVWDIPLPEPRPARPDEEAPGVAATSPSNALPRCFPSLPAARPSASGGGSGREPPALPPVPLQCAEDAEKRPSAAGPVAHQMFGRCDFAKIQLRMGCDIQEPEWRSLPDARKSDAASAALARPFPSQKKSSRLCRHGSCTRHRQTGCHGYCITHVRLYENSAQKTARLRASSKSRKCRHVSCEKHKKSGCGGYCIAHFRQQRDSSEVTTDEEAATRTAPAAPAIDPTLAALMGAAGKNPDLLGSPTFRAAMAAVLR